MEQFDNMYILNTVTNLWSKIQQHNQTGGARWNFSAVSVVAVPFWKIFVFGGNSGELYDGGNPQGKYLNDTCVWETGTNTWVRPSTIGTLPCERGETPIVYDSKGSRIILFGGWANRWFGDLFVCKVSDVVGPPYSITTITPVLGPITGSTQCTIHGTGFKSGGSQAIVRLASLKGFVEVKGEVVSDSEIVFETPSFEKYGALDVEGRVGVGGKSLTNSSVPFSYFSVASCSTTVCFGPACLNECVAAYPVTLIIQARDASGELQLQTPTPHCCIYTTHYIVKFYCIAVFIWYLLLCCKLYFTNDTFTANTSVTQLRIDLIRM
jgi:dynein heavy chain, axonemal